MLPPALLDMVTEERLRNRMESARPGGDSPSRIVAWAAALRRFGREVDPPRAAVRPAPPSPRRA